MIANWFRENRALRLYLIGLVAALVGLFLAYWLWGRGWIVEATVAGGLTWLREMAGSPEPPDALAAIGVVADQVAMSSLVGLGVLGLAMSAKLVRVAPPAGMWTRLLGGVLVLALYIFVSQVVVSSFIERPGLHNFKTATLGDTVELRSEKPFAKRLLMPLILNRLHVWTPPDIRKRVADWARQSVWFDSRSASTKGVEGYEYEFMAAVVLMVALYTLTLIGIGELIDRLYDIAPLHTRLTAPLLFALVHPVLFEVNSYVYDMGTIALVTWALVFIVRDQPLRFLLLFPVGLLNKESFVVCGVCFAAVYALRAPRGRYVAYIAALAASCVAVLLIIVPMMTSGLPGAVFEYPLRDNLYFLLVQNVGYLLVGSEFTLYVFPHLWFALLLLAAAWRWPAKHPFLREACLSFLPFLFVAELVFGIFREWRIFTEAVPLLVALIFETLLLAFAADTLRHRPLPHRCHPDSWWAWCRAHLPFATWLERRAFHPSVAAALPPIAPPEEASDSQ